MARNASSNQPIPSSIEPLNGMLRKSTGKTWEFNIGKADELKKLPNYPDTHLTCPEGIAVTLKHGKHQCVAAFHGFYTPVAFIFIGSARGLYGAAFTNYYRAFLSAFGITVGVNISPIPIKLAFRAGNVVYV